MQLVSGIKVDSFIFRWLQAACLLLAHKGKIANSKLALWAICCDSCFFLSLSILFSMHSDGISTNVEAKTCITQINGASGRLLFVYVVINKSGF